MSGGTTLTETPFPPKPSVTVADELIFHYISDGELEMLMHERSDGKMQLFWACLGICGGTVQGAVAALIGWLSGTPKLVDQIPLFLICAAAPLGIYAYGLAQRQLRQEASLGDRIRSRTRVPAPTNLRLDHDPNHDPGSPTS